AHFYNFLGATDLKSRIDGHHLVDVDDDSLLLVLFKAGQFKLNRIGSGLNFDQDVVSAVIGQDTPVGPGRFIGGDDFHSRQHRAAGIGHAAQNAAAGALGRHDRRADQAQTHDRTQDDEPTKLLGRFRQRHGTDPPDPAGANFVSTRFQ